MKRNILSEACPESWWQSLLETRRNMAKAFGRTINEDQAKQEIIHDYQEMHRLGNEAEIPERYSDVWFAWYFGDNDFTSTIAEAMEYIATEWVSCFQQDLENLGQDLYYIQENQGKPIDDFFGNEVQKTVERLTEQTKLGNIVFSRCDRYKALSSPEILGESLRYLTATYTATRHGFDKAEFDQHLEYLGPGDGDVVIGKSEVLSLLQKASDSGMTMTEDNYKTSCWADSGLVVCRIKEGEIDITIL